MLPTDVTRPASGGSAIELSGVRLRDAWVIVALAFLPAVVLGLLGLRALGNEDAAVRREAALALEATATRLSSAVERGLDEAATPLTTVDLSGFTTDAALAGALAPLSPPFAEPIVLDANGALRIPALPLAPDHDETAPARCEEERRVLADHGASRAARDASIDYVLASCEHARGPSGAFLWPTIALGDAQIPTARIAEWTRAHLARLTPVERASVRADAVQSGRDAVRALLDGVDPRTDALASALSDPGVRRALKEGAVRSDRLFARVRRIADGRWVGFAAHPTTLASWASTAAPPGLTAEVTSAEAAAARKAPPEERAWAPLGPSLAFVVRPSDPRALALRTSRARRVLGATAAFGAAIAVVAAVLVFVRLRAERRSAALRTDFVSTVSHELRTPLASIRMLAELLEERRVEEDEREEVHEALAREARRMSELVDRLLGFGRMAAGRSVARRERTRVDALVAEAIDELEAREPAMPKVVRELAQVSADVDPGQLRLALDNLLGNARKYAPDGGPYEVRLADEGARFVLSVRDRGPGIARRDRRRIFQPFERGDERLARATEGSGIGLSLVAHVAKAHDGEVTLDSEPGRGATFTLRLAKSVGGSRA